MTNQPFVVGRRRPPISLDTVLDQIRSCVDEMGVEAYLVGGFVRDRLMGRSSKDIDLLVVGSEALPVLSCVARSFSWPPPVQFERFNTAQIRGEGFVIEVVGARAERYDPASRKPEVRPGTLEEDIWRRDFTVNALCQTLAGRVIDMTGHGLDDLHTGTLRTPLDPSETFSEDPLRMLRAARFVSQLGFRLAPGLIEGMRREAGRVSIVSIERVSEELRRLLTGSHPREGMDVVRSGGLLERLLPEVAAMHGVEQSGYHVYDVYDHTMHALAAAPPDLVTRLAVLCHDIGKPPTRGVGADGRHIFYNHDVVGAEISERMLTRLRFSNDEISAVCRLVRLHLRPIQYRADFGDSAVRRLIRDAGDLRAQLLDLARADTLASAYPDLENIAALERRMGELDQGGEVSALTSPLDGEEIMALGGRGPGPWVGRVKRALLDAVLDGEIMAGDREAARRWLQTRADLLRE
ncbi:MAG TPA: HD domain-containing protein [Candidatus Sulfotelmatobacter sp.]|nr:HD domain-containing protein [Candidatus Sulfotelmatobacter sp.]